MTETAKEACPRCGGKSYLLNNAKGQVQATACACFHCEKCGGQGRVYFQNAIGASYVKKCECAELPRRLDLLTAASIPGKFAGAGFDNYDTTGKYARLGLALKRAKDLVNDFRPGIRGLVFSGGPGLGKTHLAVAILKALVLEKGVTCRFVDFFQLLADIRHAYSEDRSDQSIINPYVYAPVLVIDELAKGRNTEWELTVLDQIIAARYNSADKVTLFTTNYQSEAAVPGPEGKKSRSGEPTDTADFGDLLTRQMLQERIGPRIYSRLVEMCEFVMMQGDDFRQKELPNTRQYPRPRSARY
jgi:DNA replication protein DnaC